MAVLYYRSRSNATHATLSPSKRGFGSAKERDLGRSRAFEWSLLGLFAFLLALITVRHEMWEDELQAWLIARDTSSLAGLFHNMRYEGHPVLWQLILYVPAHLSWNPASMQVINYMFAIAEAWMIVSARKLHPAIRALTIFSFFIFYQYGVVARNYMLAIVLLTAATRCFLAERPRRKLGVIFLALSINAHFFAIPIAAIVAFQALGVATLKGWGDFVKLTRNREVQVCSAVLFIGVLAAYFTIRPPADPFTHHGIEQYSLGYNLLSTESRAWQALIPPNSLTDRASWLESSHYFGSNPERFVPAAGFSLALFLLVGAALRTAKARSLFVTASAFEVLVMSGVYRPALWHFGLIFTAFILALLTDAFGETNGTRRPWLPGPVGLAVVLTILSFQTISAVTVSRDDWKYTYSYAKETSSWLIRAGLQKRPLVIMPYSYGAAILGYMRRSSAYYPACRCVGSFAVLRAGVDRERLVTEEELEALSRSSDSLPLVLSGSELSVGILKSLHLHELSAFAEERWAREKFYIYERREPERLPDRSDGTFHKLPAWWSHNHGRNYRLLVDGVFLTQDRFTLGNATSAPSGKASVMVPAAGLPPNQSVTVSVQSRNLPNATFTEASDLSWRGEPG